jgi:predicted dehydrogenase
MAGGALLGGFVAKAQNQPLPVAIISLEHGHASGVFNTLAKTGNIKLVAVVEPDKTLRNKYATQYHLDSTLFYDTMDAMFAKVKPRAVLIYSPPNAHRAIVQKAAEHGVDAMMEKPMATTLEDALAMRDTARKYHTKVLVNYETSWYGSNAEVLRAVSAGKLGTVHKVVVHDGHNGPVEIGVPPEFLKWLTDPVGNGAGAMFDFGCYGADLMTVMMHGEAPLSVTAVAQTNKPEEYSKVDDDATIILRYPKAQAVLMPSWDWPFSRKDMEVYGTKGYAIAVDPMKVTTRFAEKSQPVTETTTVPLEQTNSLEYLAAIERGQIDGAHDLSAIDTNIVTMQILDAAKRSVKEGRTVAVTPVPK